MFNIDRVYSENGEWYAACTHPAGYRKNESLTEVDARRTLWQFNLEASSGATDVMSTFWICHDDTTVDPKQISIWLKAANEVKDSKRATVRDGGGVGPGS